MKDNALEPENVESQKTVHEVDPPEDQPDEPKTGTLNSDKDALRARLFGKED